VSASVLVLALRWAAPPVIGAVVGYAFVAIGLRVGFLRSSSRGRRAVAGGVGRLVAADLITDAGLKARLRSPKVVEQISHSVSVLSAQVLATPASELANEGESVTGISVGGIFEGLFQRLRGSRALIYTVRDLATRLVDSLSGKKLQEILSRFDIKTLLSERVLASLAEPQKRHAVARSLAEAFAGQAGDVLSDEVLEHTAALLEPSVPHAAERIIEWLKSAETRAYLSEQGRELLPRILEKLNVLQRFLLSAGQFDRRLTEKMPEIVDETIATLQGMLRDSTQQRRVSAAILQAARDWRDGLASSNREKGIDSVVEVVERLLATLEDPSVREKVSQQLVERLMASDPTVGGIARQIAGKRDDEMIDALSAWALTFLTRKETLETIARSVGSLVEGMRAEDPSGTIGELLHIDAQRKAGIDEYLTLRILDLLGQRLPEMLREMNVERLVSDAIEGFDTRVVRRPARIVAGVGALVGFLVGIVGLFLGLVL
jgi:hypothetical protein